MTASQMSISRRGVLAGGGALIVSFSLPRPPLAQETQAPRLPGSLRNTPLLDAWLRIDAKGVTLFTGKVELGQGIKTALLQIAAEELSVAPGQIELVTADTARTPDERYTAGSQSMQDSGTAIRHASAQAREIMIAAAAARLGVPAEHLEARNGAVAAADGRTLRYGELVSSGLPSGSAGTAPEGLLHVAAQAQSKLKDPQSYSVIGKPVQRIDIPAKVTGGIAYVQDLRLPGMVHARVVRPPSYGARLQSLETAAVERMPGVLKIVRDGSFL